MGLVFGFIDTEYVIYFAMMSSACYFSVLRLTDGALLY